MRTKNKITREQHRVKKAQKQEGHEYWRKINDLVINKLSK